MAALVKQFSDEPDTCLFGTMSLWQGVDVPGGSCRLVVIDRIPFPRPDDPLMTARSRAVAQSGGNGFMAVSATHAAIRLAQAPGASSGRQGTKAWLPFSTPGSPRKGTEASCVPHSRHSGRRRTAR